MNYSNSGLWICLMVPIDNSGIVLIQKVLASKIIRHIRSIIGSFVDLSIHVNNKHAFWDGRVRLGSACRTTTSHFSKKTAKNARKENIMDWTKQRTIFLGKVSRKALRTYLRHRVDNHPALWITDDGER